MKIVEVLKNKKYLLIALSSSIIMSLAYLYIQVLGIIENIPFWFSIVPIYNIVLFLIFTILFGTALSYQMYIRAQPKFCVGTSSSATIGVFLISQCPACASLGLLFLPLSIVGLLAKYNWAVNLVSISLLLYTLNYLGAFKR